LPYPLKLPQTSFVNVTSSLVDTVTRVCSPSKLYVVDLVVVWLSLQNLTFAGQW